MSGQVTQLDPEELRETAVRLLADHVDRRRGYAADSDDGKAAAALFAAMAELGWLLLPVPEAAGGLEQGFAALAPIYEELGRALAPTQIADTLGAAQYLAGTAQPPLDLLEQLGSGEVRAAVAFAPVGADTARVSAVFEPVLDAGDATHMLVVDASGADAGACWIDIAGEGVNCSRIETWDRSRAAYRIELDQAPVLRFVAGRPQGAAELRAHLDLATAWDCVGGAAQVLDESIAYMQTRQQFGRPIGSFQALKHRAADLKVMLDMASALARRATARFAARADDWATAAAQAKLLAAECYRSLAEENIQFHGGIGFTWEHDAHLYFKRAWLNEVLGGTGDEYRARIAPALLAVARNQKG